MRRRGFLAATLLCAGGVAVPCLAAPHQVPYGEIFDTVRRMAASLMGRKSSEVDTVTSLFAQGMTERQFDELIRDLEAEYGILIPDNELHQAKWKDSVAGLSVRRVADMVQRRMRDPFP